MTNHPSIRGSTSADISSSIEDAVRNGRLNAGARLPPVRNLAHTLRVSPGTVASAYQSLCARGILVTEGRRGTKVSHRPLQGARMSITAPAGCRNLYDGNPDPALLPPLAPVLKSIDGSFHMYGEPNEFDKLVKVARRDFDDDGVSPGDICVTNGALDGIERILIEHLRAGDRVGVEDPGFGSIFDLVMSLGLSLVPIRVDKDGIVPASLGDACRAGIKVLIVSPRGQNPTGAVFTPSRVKALRAVISKHPDLLTIEDDHANFVTNAPLCTLHDGRNGRWAYIRSLSKAINPDMRLALMTGDESTLTRVRDRLIVGGRWVSHVLQRIAHAQLADRSVRRSLQAAGRTYSSRRIALIDALRSHEIPCIGQSGFNVWVPVPEETATVQALASLGWAVSAGERFRIESPPAIRVTTATLEEKEARQFAEDLAKVLSRRSIGIGA